MTAYMHLQQQRRKTSEQNAFFAQLIMTFSQSLMPVGMSNLGSTGLILANSRVKINEICYRDLFISQPLLPAIRQVYNLDVRSGV